ncbi:MAG: histidine phosphatase family protein [bacterium]|nr:histidine phosphatase family protein [bacterium]
MNLYLVRHGQSEGNIPGASAVGDPPLTERGRAQAACVADTFAAEPVAALYASPMTRALETATIIGERLFLSPRVRPILAETGRLRWNNPPDAGPLPKSGLTLFEVTDRFPHADVSDAEPLDGVWWRKLHGERRAGAYARAMVALDQLCASHPDDEENVVVVTHGAFGSVLMSVALDAPPSDFNRFGQFNAGISLLHIIGDVPRLRRLNWVEHLPPDLRTDCT